MAPLRYAAKFDPWHNPRKEGDQILPSGYTDVAHVQITEVSPEDLGYRFLSQFVTVAHPLPQTVQATVEDPHSL